MTSYDHVLDIKGTTCMWHIPSVLKFLFYSILGLSEEIHEAEVLVSCSEMSDGDGKSHAGF